MQQVQDAEQTVRALHGVAALQHPAHQEGEARNLMGIKLSSSYPDRVLLGEEEHLGPGAAVGAVGAGEGGQGGQAQGVVKQKVRDGLDALACNRLEGRLAFAQIGAVARPNIRWIGSSMHSNHTWGRGQL